VAGFLIYYQLGGYDSLGLVSGAKNNKSPQPFDFERDYLEKQKMAFLAEQKPLSQKLRYDIFHVLMKIV